MINFISQIQAVQQFQFHEEPERPKVKFEFASKPTGFEPFRKFGHWARTPIDYHWGRVHVHSTNALLLITACLSIAAGLILYIL
jgi:hypothetical protein